MAILESVQTNYPAINKAAGDFLTKLTGTDIKKDITLAAEMAGLMLLRASSAPGPKAVAGMVVLGAIPDDAYHAINRFVLGFALSNGLNPKDIDIAAIPADAKTYLPELTRFEQSFYETCQNNNIGKDLFPFTAAASAGKLVLAGNKLGLLNARIGLAMVLFHIVAGSKTVPYPPQSDSQGRPE